MTEVQIVTTPPAIPNKNDIIPIHASDIASFKRCRRYWDWTSPTRTNLRRKVQIYGVNPNLWFGTGIHWALQMMYDPILQRDPVEAFSTWFALQWEGGIVRKDFLDQTYDIKPVEVPVTSEMIGTQYIDASTGIEVIPDEEKRYRIEGLRDLLPDPDEEEFFGYRDLGIGMMEFYKGYAAREDNFTVIAAESTFSVPLGFEWKDSREESPNYGEMLEVHARGKRDMIYQHNETLHFGIQDYKTKTKIDDSYRVSLENDAQVTTYMWASQEEAKIHDLPYKVIHEAFHQAMRKVYPQPPTPLKNGLPSLNRTEESATAEMFIDYINEHNLMPIYTNDVKMQNYYTFLVEEGDKRFIERNFIPRNQHEIAATGQHIKAIAWEMLNSPYIYPNPNGDYLCVHCALRAPCLAKDDGSDYTAMLKDGYEQNRDR